jgi:hypothetical protein
MVSERISVFCTFPPVVRHPTFLDTAPSSVPAFQSRSVKRSDSLGNYLGIVSRDDTILGI